MSVDGYPRKALEADAIHAELSTVAPEFDAGKRPERDAG